jgi:DNA/RNA-binding domain of Phe-tRNA-synthetase-like protein
MNLSISNVVSDFPQFHVAFLFGYGLRVTADRPEWLDRFVESCERDVMLEFGQQALAEIQEIKGWRAAYRKFGVKKTRYRSSVESLLRRVLKGDQIPEINTLVDGYNAFSLKHLVAMGANDLDHVTGDLAFRFSRPDDQFVPIARPDTTDHVPTGEVVYADQKTILCRRWNWQQSIHSKISGNTTNVVLTLESLSHPDLPEIAHECSQLLQRICGGTFDMVFLDRGTPEMTVVPHSTK